MDIRTLREPVFKGIRVKTPEVTKVAVTARRPWNEMGDVWRKAREDDGWRMEWRWVATTAPAAESRGY